MNLLNKKSLHKLPLIFKEELPQEKQVGYYDDLKKRFRKTKIQINLIKDHQIIYSRNGAIIKVVEADDAFENLEIFHNLDQIQYLSWQGQYSQKKTKEGKWVAYWDKYKLNNVNGYFKNGQKQGFWQDLFPNFCNQVQIYEIGEYHDDLRIGYWSYIFFDKKIGGGLYNNVGKKQGKWVELDEGFYIDKQVIYKGEYNMNGMKIGRWDILYCKDDEDGGGLYDKEGNQKKIGQWIELDEAFLEEKQITYRGEYNMNGMKVNRWEIMYCKQNEQEYKYIGGGSYDKDGNLKKIGRWVDLDEGFQQIQQVIFIGEYNLNGKKIGKWEIMQGRRDGKYNLKDKKPGKWGIMQGRSEEKEYQKIGGGSYDFEGNQIKIGKWAELEKDFYFGFQDSKQVIYNGEYNTNGMKIGMWNIMYCKHNEKEYKFIGCGSYDIEGNQKKIGKWTELDEGFELFKQVTWNGEYYTNGMKIGMWVIKFCESYEKEYKQIGGGCYDEEGKQKKIGKWVELDEGFYSGIFDSKQVTYNGEYNMNGMKIGIWNTMYCKLNQKVYQKIGGGLYDQEGNQKKIGKWVELDEGFYYYKQILYNGQYDVNGTKVGRWVKIDKQDNSKRQNDGM